MTCFDRLLSALHLTFAFLLLLSGPVQGQTITVNVPNRSPAQPAARVQLVLQLDANASPASATVQRRSSGSLTGSSENFSGSGSALVGGDFVTYREDDSADQITVTFAPENNFSSPGNFCQSNFSALNTDGYQVSLSGLGGTSITAYSVTTYTIASTEACNCDVRRTKTPPIASASSPAFSSGVSSLRSPIDVTLVVDKSGSIGWTASGTGGMTRKQVLVSAMEAFIDAWTMEASGNGADRLGLTFFDANAHVPPTLSSPFFVRRDASGSPTWGDLKTDVQNLSPGGSTSMGDGLIEAYDQMSEFKGGQIILVTDGMQNTAELVETCGALGTPSGCTNPSHYAVLNPSTGSQEPLATRCRVIHPVGIGLVGSYGTELNTIAGQTGGESGLASPSTTAMMLANQLVNVLKGNTLDKVMQESGTLPAAQQSLPPDRFVLNRSTGQLMVMLNWLGAQNANALDVRLIGPNGQERRATQTARGDFHVVKSIEFEEEAEPGQWAVQIRRNRGTGSDVDYQMTVLADELLFSHEVAFSSLHTFVGEPITLQLALGEGGTPITDLDPDAIEVEVQRPRTALGTFLFEQQVPEENLRRDPERAKGDPLGSPFARKIEYLKQEGTLQEATASERIEAPAMQRGRPDKEDQFVLGSEGVYALTLDDTKMPGTYEFRIRFAVETERSGSVSRVIDAQRVVDVRPNLANSEVEAEGQGETLRIRFVPRDLNGNYLGPGYADNLGVTAPDRKTPFPAEVTDEEARGIYEMRIEDVPVGDNPRLLFRIHGRPYHAVTVKQLLSGDIPKDPGISGDDSTGGTGDAGGGCTLGSGGSSGVLVFSMLLVGFVAVRRRRYNRTAR